MRKQLLSVFSIISVITSVDFTGANLYCQASERSDTVPVFLPSVNVVSGESSKTVTSSTPYQKIDAERIKLTGITDISDAMNRLPGVNVRDYGGAGGLKTVSVRGLGAGHTAVVYDGVALSDCQSGQIDLSRYSLDNVSAISLYSGDNDDIFMPAKAAASASSIYISSFTAPSPSDKGLHLNARMRTGSFGFYNPFLRISKGFGKYSFSFNTEFIHADNDYTFKLQNGKYITKEKRQNSNMNSWHGELNYRVRLAPASILNAKLYYYDNSRRLPGPVVYYVTKTDEHMRDRNFFGQIQFKGKVADKLSVLSTAKFNWATSHYRDFDQRYASGVLDNYYIQREAYITGALLFTPSSFLSLDYSADWAWNNLSSNTDNNIRPLRHTVLQSLAAKCVFGRVTAMGRLLYSLYFNDAKDGDAGKNQSRFSPMVSVSVKPFEGIGLYVRGGYKNIFRLPTFNEAYYDNYGSINLDPETTDQFNLGVTYQASSVSWMPDLSITCDGYLNHVKNKIVAVPYNLFLWRMTNLGKVRVFGVDLTLNSTFRLSRRHALTLVGSYSFQRAEPRTSPDASDWMKQVAYIPRNSGSVSLSWLNPWVDVAIHSNGMDDRYTTNNNLPETRIPGFFETGVALSHKFTFKKCSMEVRGDLINLFNSQYEIVARYPMPGSSWKLAFEFNL